MSRFNDLYVEAKGLLKKIQTKGYFNLYSTRDFFYLLDENSRGVVVLSEHLYNNGYGVQLFYNNSGLNYLHDILCTETESPVNYFYSNCMILGFIPKADLHPDDIGFLRGNNIRLSKDYNFIPIYFKEGYGKCFMSCKELKIMIKYLYYLLALTSNEKEDLNEAFARNVSPIAVFNNTEMTYSVHYNDLPMLEKLPKKTKRDENLIKDFEGTQYINDTCYFFHSYFPLRADDNSAYRTLIVCYYVESKKYKIDAFDVEPNKIDEVFFGYMDEIFHRYGLPTNVVFNHRKLYSVAYNTLTALNIEVSFNRENKDLDGQMYAIMMEDVQNKLSTLDPLDEFGDIEELDDIDIEDLDDDFDFIS